MLATVSLSAVGATKPNVVIIVADDLGWGDAIVPCQKEIPYGVGRKEFVAPKEWKVTEY